MMRRKPTIMAMFNAKAAPMAPAAKRIAVTIMTLRLPKRSAMGSFLILATMPGMRAGSSVVNSRRSRRTGGRPRVKKSASAHTFT